MDMDPVKSLRLRADSIESFGRAEEPTSEWLRRVANAIEDQYVPKAREDDRPAHVLGARE